MNSVFYLRFRRFIVVMLMVTLVSLAFFKLFYNEEGGGVSVVVDRRVQEFREMMDLGEFDLLNAEFPKLPDSVKLSLECRFIESDLMDLAELELTFYNESVDVVEFLNPTLIHEVNVDEDMLSRDGSVALRADYAFLISSASHVVELAPKSSYSIKVEVKLPNGSSRCNSSVSLFTPIYSAQDTRLDRIRYVSGITQGHR